MPLANYPFNYSGLPAVSVPAGWDGEWPGDHRPTPGKTRWCFAATEFEVLRP